MIDPMLPSWARLVGGVVDVETGQQRDELDGTSGVRISGNDHES